MSSMEAQQPGTRHVAWRQRPSSLARFVPRVLSRWEPNRDGTLGR